MTKTNDLHGAAKAAPLRKTASPEKGKNGFFPPAAAGEAVPLQTPNFGFLRRGFA
jgi:hypothetical protein